MVTTTYYTVFISIRLMFSIADIQTQEPEFEEETEATPEEDDATPSYPLRCSFSITKVRHLSFVMLTFEERKADRNL